MSDEGYNLFGAIAGGIGIVTVFPLLACWLLSQLPTAKMRELDQMLSDTESLLDSSVREGLLHGGNDFQPFRVRLWAVQLRADDLRGKLYDVNTWKEEWDSWWKGSSGAIRLLRTELSKLRVALVVSFDVFLFFSH
ncbi:hypothetical protein BV20DRAFT_1057916 [Pilatotrama ljubarskyi]|nr:hypothetical protein BV20DRAFT_1057916 [Pilatotrama ljubarskyi]